LGKSRLGGFETSTPSYYLVNIHWNYLQNKVLGKKHQVALDINNVFNATFYNHLSQLKNIMPESGRSLSLQYQIDL